MIINTLNILSLFDRSNTGWQPITGAGGEAKNSMIQIKKHDYILHNSHSVTSTSKSIEINDFRRKMIRSNMPHYL